MRKLGLLLFLFVQVAFAQQTKDLYILHTNDTHSRIYPYSKYFAEKDKADKGGFIRRLAFVRQERRQYPDLMLFDCGDFSQGSPYYNIYKGEVEVKLMNMMHYDVVTIGNHEFDFGMENLVRLYRMATFKVVCANYHFEGTVLDTVVKPYVMLYRNGLKIGVFGISPELNGLVQKSNCQGVAYEDPVKAAMRVASYLKHIEKCDLVICLSHLGWKNGDNDDSHLIANTRDIDIVLGGHSHTYFVHPEWVNNLDGTPIPDTQMGKNGQFVGKLKLTMTEK